jgi:uncharacterized protein
MTRQDDSFKYISQYIETLPVFSDHEHHGKDEMFTQGMSLEKSLAAAYVAWTGYASNGKVPSRKALLDNVRFNSYFVWFQKGLQKVHHIDEDITLENWDRISEVVRKAYADDKDFHWKTLKDNGYDKLVQDSFWDPGSDEGHPEVLIPTFRIDKFMYGHHAEAIAPDNIIPWQKYGFSGKTLDEYVELMRETIRARRKAGKVAAFKCAEAYSRPLDFLPDDYESARQAFGVHPDKITAEQKILFGNYIFNRCCELAAELDVPFQIHTGLARLSGSQPMRLEPVIARHSRTRFVLFHSGFPWTHEVTGLTHNYRNVLPSMTWTPTISTWAAIRTLHEFIDVSSSVDKITWGSDCFVPEDSVGAMLAWRFVVAKVLSQRLDDGFVKRADVEPLARKLMFESGRLNYHT